jgi:uncharacterized protein YjbJ (UPF0337 family)
MMTSYFILMNYLIYYFRGAIMNKDQIEGNWKQLKGKVKQQWGKLTDDQIDVIEGRRQELAGKIQEAYGLSKSEAEEQIAEWEKQSDKDIN